jgi:taurine dioxygenase
MFLGSLFGPVEEHAYVKGLDDFPQITRIIKSANEKNQWGEGWHSDVSYDVTPCKTIILRSIKIPPVGGDTVFSNMELAWETLDEDIKEIIIDKSALHTSNGSNFFVEDFSEMESNGKIGEKYSNEHPIVRTHPETGNKILYVNPTYTKKKLLVFQKKKVIIYWREYLDIKKDLICHVVSNGLKMLWLF